MNTESIDRSSVRPSAIAGTWYPGTREELEETVDGLLARAKLQATDDELIALVAPHAGYPYSGQMAAQAYRQLSGRSYDLVILLGPNHSENFGHFSVSSKKFYSTPLGLVQLDQAFIADLAKRVPLARVERDREHSLEIQLPFMQRVLGTFTLVPIMMLLPFYIVGTDALEPCKDLATALAELTASRRALLVASSDLSHLSDYAAVDRFDARTAELVQNYDIPELVNYMSEGDCRACGDAPIVTALLAAKQLGANRIQVLGRTHSGEVTGKRTPGQYTVGYMAVAVYKSKGKG